MGSNLKPGDLTPRQREVVILIGKHRLSYKAAAKQLENLLSCDPGQCGDHISWHTVRQYAVQIRDLMGSRLSPRDALTALYWEYRKSFDHAA